MVMKCIAALLLFMIPVGLDAQVRTSIQWTEKSSLPASDVVYYRSGNKLIWDDFQGKPGEAGKTAAITMSGFGYSASMHANGKSGDLEIKVYCFFNKKKSWVKPGKTTAYILTHEQRHFDVSYIAANIFIDKVQSAAIGVSDYNSIISRIYNECIEIMNQMQDEYDEQSDNGQDKENQEKWNRFIDGKLAIIKG